MRLPRQQQKPNQIAEHIHQREDLCRYVQVLRLLEHYGQNVLHATIKDALQMGAISFDAIKHFVLCRVECKQPRLDLDLYPFLPRMNVVTTSAKSYMSLLTGRGA